MATSVCSSAPRSKSRGYHVVPGWQTNVVTNATGRPSYADAARCSNMLHIQACNPHEDDVLWLKGCLLAEAKNCDILNDIRSLLSDAGFAQVKPKYVGGLRLLLECSSVNDAQQLLEDKAQVLSQWFSWVCLWSKEKEACRPGRLVWLFIEGVPLHAWNPENFHALANTFGRVMEVERENTFRACLGAGEL